MKMRFEQRQQLSSSGLREREVGGWGCGLRGVREEEVMARVWRWWWLSFGGGSVYFPNRGLVGGGEESGGF